MSISRSAFEAIPGKDALVEYSPQVYPQKTYVEREGLIYKSIIETSSTFVPGEWELVADLREVRVPDINSRNALTGNTPTTGTTGIRIPILDNTNVLVLDASDDPLVGSTFARYNYNQALGSWLLLQAGTGNTNSNISDYTSLTNKPSVISGATVNAGAGLTGGGSIFGTSVAPYAAGGSVTVSHADTSSIGNTSNSGYAYVQNLSFDGFGHVTGVTQSTWVHPTGLTLNVSNSPYTYIKSISMVDGHVTSVASEAWIHPDTSTQASSINSGSVYIQGISLDGSGHVTGINTGTIPAGGVGYSLKLNGDSGGVITMLSGATVNITGGTNISTVRTGGPTNGGIRINFNPAGSNTQLQFNNGGFLGSSANLTFNTGTNTLTTTSFNLSGVPASGITSTDQILTRNPSTGAIQRISSHTFAALPVNAIQYKLSSGGFGGNANWLFDPVAIAVTLGSRTGTTGIYSFTSGDNNLASADYSYATGYRTKATANSAHAEGNRTTASGFRAHAEGSSTLASGSDSHAEGNLTSATTNSSHAQGYRTIASGSYSHAGGYNASTVGKEIKASGVASFNHSTNDVNQIAGHGALAQSSAILGGLNHNIEVGNSNAVIVGGNNIKLTGSTYSNYTAVSNLAIMSTPVAGITADDVLVRSATTGRIKSVPQSSLAGVATPPAGSVSQIQYNSGSVFGANAGLTFNTGTTTLITTNLNVSNSTTLSSVPVTGTLNDNILIRNTSTGVIEKISTSSIGTANNAITKTGNNYRLGGALTGNTTISGVFNLTFSNNSWTFGNRLGVVGGNSLTVGSSNTASATDSISIQSNNTASGAASYAQGSTNTSSGSASHAEGQLNIASGNYSHAEGNYTQSSGGASHAGGFGNDVTRRVLASGAASFNHSTNTVSQVVGHGALATNSAILGGQDHNIEASNINAVIVGGTEIKLTGSSYQNYTAVANLAIMTAPATGVASDVVLVRSATTGRIRSVTQASLTGVATPPAGSNTQIQYNNSGVFGASANLTFTSGSNILATTNLSLSGTQTFTSVPATGTLNDNILIRDTATGIVQKIATSSIGTANNGLNKIGNNYRLGGALTGNTIISGAFNLTFTNNSITLGDRSGTVGGYSLAAGTGLVASGSYASAFGFNNTSSGFASIAHGSDSVASASGTYAGGANVIASGVQSHAQNIRTTASGQYTHAGGQGFDATKPVLASGSAAFNHSTNTVGQVVGHGALGTRSAILGGQDHNIESGNVNAVIIGGSGIKLTGSTYSNYTAVGNLAIMTAPDAGTASDVVLVRSATTGRIRSVTQASLTGGGGTSPAGSNTQIQYNNSGVFGASANLTFSSGSNTLLTTNLTLGGTQTFTSVPATGISTDKVLVRDTTTGVVKQVNQFTNSAANTELMKSDGANAISSKVFIPSNGNITMGDGTLAGNRSITVASSAGTTDLKFIAQGASGKYTFDFTDPFARELQIIPLGTTDVGINNSTSGYVRINNTATVNSTGNMLVGSGTVNYITIGYNGSVNGIVGINGSVSNQNGTGVSIIGGAGYITSGNGSGGTVTLTSGLRRTAGTGLDGDIVLNSLTGSIKFTQALANDNALTDVLVRDSATGIIKFRTAASISGGGGGGTPAGSNTQIQYNNSGSFGASANLTFSTGTNTLLTTNLSLSGIQTFTSVPATGISTDKVLVRDTTTGVVKQVNQFTNTAANTELMMSDGTNAVPSDIFKVGSNGIQFGSASSIGTGRILYPEAIGTNVNMVLRAKGTSGHVLLNDTVIANGGYVGIGLLTPVRKLHVESRYSSTNIVEYTMRLARSSSSSTTVGSGLGIEFHSQAQGVYDLEQSATLEVVSTDLGAGTEDFDMVFKTQQAGGAPSQRLRLNGDNTILGVSTLASTNKTIKVESSSSQTSLTLEPKGNGQFGNVVLINSGIVQQFSAATPKAFYKVGNWAGLTSSWSNRSISGGIQLNLFTANDGTTSIINGVMTVRLMAQGISDDGAQVYSTQKIYTFKKDGAANPVQVGPTTVLHDVDDTTVGTPTCVLTPNLANIELQYNSGNAGFFLTWSFFVEITSSAVI